MAPYVIGYVCVLAVILILFKGSGDMEARAMERDRELYGDAE